MTDKSLVRQHNKIVEAKYKLSVGEQRLIKMLVSMIERDDEDFKVYKIHVNDLIKLLGLSDKDFYGKVKAWSKKLIGNVLVFRGEDEEELQVSWLSSAVYKPKKGFVELEFSPKLKPFLLHLKSHFTAYELGNIVSLKHTHSIRMYELMKQYEKIGKRRLTIDKLRDLLMIQEDEYKQFSDFRKRILKTAQSELSEKTDISFSWEEEKQNQKCVAISFFIKSQNRPQAQIQSKQPINEPEISDDQQDIQSIEQLVFLGVTRSTAESLTKEYDEKQIQSAIAYTQAQKNDGKLNNPAGFLVDAIRKGFRDNHGEERKQKEEAKRKEQERLGHQEQWSQIKKAYQTAVSGEALRQYEALGEEEKKATWEDFYAAQSPLERKMIDRNREGAPARGFLLGYLKKTLALPSFTEWAQATSVDVSGFQAEMKWEKLV